MSEEMNRPQPEKVEVFSNTETTGGVTTPGPGLPPAVPVSQLRGAGLSNLTPEERKARKKANDADSYKKRKDKKSVASYVFDSATEPTKAEAKEILSARGLKNDHIIDLCYDLSLIAAEQNNVPANRFLLQNGIRKMLASYEAETPQALEAIPAEEVAGELLNGAELYAHSVLSQLGENSPLTYPK